MKTFVILFIIAISLPTEAQRVRENVRQKAVIIENNKFQMSDLNDNSKDEDRRERRKEREEKQSDAKRKQ